MRCSRLIMFALSALVGLVAAGCPETKGQGSTDPRELRVVSTPGRLERRFDEQRQMTLLRVRPPTPPPAGRSLALVAAGGFRGKVPQAYTGVLVGLRSAGARWHLEACQEIAIFAGERELGRFGATRETEIGRGWLAEYVLAVVPFTRAYALVAAPEIAIVACGQRHRLRPDEHARLRELVGALRPGQP